MLDAVHEIQATQANDLACRWNCKAGKCGSCSAEINGMPKLMCMTRLDELPLDTEDRLSELKQLAASATATSPSAAPRSVPKTSPSRITRLFR